MPGVDDELTLVCKGILTLVSRTAIASKKSAWWVGPLVPTSRPSRIFDQHRIPWPNYSAALLQEPVVKTPSAGPVEVRAVNRATMLEVLTSPWNRRLMAGGGSLAPRPDQWRLAAQVLGITRGEEEWRRLEQVTHSWNPGRTKARLDVQTNRSFFPVDATQLLMALERSLPPARRPEGTAGVRGYAALTEAFCALAERHCAIDLGDRAIR